MRIEIQEEARIELREALIWYDEQQDGLAADLLLKSENQFQKL